MLADGGEAIADVAALADQPDLHGPVASPATAWRVLAGIDDRRLAGLRTARAVARERAWLARAEQTGRMLPPAQAAGRNLDYLVLDIDATLIEVHSEKEQASPHFQGGFGMHPILCFLDNTNEELAGILRTGRAGSNTAADHIAVLDAALGQLPETARAGRILVRTGGAGFSHAFLHHLLANGLEYSVGYAVTDDVRDAIALLPEWVWTPAVDADGGLRDGAEVAELTLVLREARRLAAARRHRERAKKAQASGQKVRPEPAKTPHWPDGMRVLVRRERPHPGAQLDAFEERDGWRYQAIATNTRVGQMAFLEARHRAHARVEDRIRQAQDAGLGRLPSKLFAINQVWLELALTAADLLAWTQTILLLQHAPSWPRPSGRQSATGSCTPPPGSPAPAAGPGCGCSSHGPGPTPWPAHSRCYAASHCPPPDPAHTRVTTPSATTAIGISTDSSPWRHRPPRRPNSPAPTPRTLIPAHEKIHSKLHERPGLAGPRHDRGRRPSRHRPAR